MYDLVKLSTILNNSQVRVIEEHLERNFKRYGTWQKSFPELSHAPYKYISPDLSPLKLTMEKETKRNIWKCQVIVSLHKFYYHISANNPFCDGDWINYLRFRLQDAAPTIGELSAQIGIDLTKFAVQEYEIGLNLNVTNDPKIYVDKIQKINNTTAQWNKRDKRDKMLDDPINYEYEKTTVKGDKTRIVFKIYDKTHQEKKEHRRKIPNIVRIELVRRRCEGVLLADLLDPKRQETDLRVFVQGFLKAKFDYTINEKGLKAGQIANIREMLDNGEESFNNKTASMDKDRRRARNKFVFDWNKGVYKNNTAIHSETEKEFKMLVLNELRGCVPYGMYEKATR